MACEAADAHTHLVRAVDLVGEDVQKHLRVGLGAEVALVGHRGLDAEGGAEAVGVREVPVVDLRRGLGGQEGAADESELRRGLDYLCCLLRAVLSRATPELRGRTR